MVKMPLPPGMPPALAESAVTSIFARPLMPWIVRLSVVHEHASPVYVPAASTWMTSPAAAFAMAAHGVAYVWPGPTDSVAAAAGAAAATSAKSAPEKGRKDRMRATIAPRERPGQARPQDRSAAHAPLAIEGPILLAVPVADPDAASPVALLLASTARAEHEATRALYAEVRALETEGGRPSKRHDEGVYYTPATLTRYIVDRTLGRTLAERRTAIWGRTGASIEAWKAYREELRRIRVLDPACGAGVFLMAAYDALRREHERVDAEIGAPPGAIVHDNLFGVDLSAESVEIARRSLVAAEHGRRSIQLDGNIRCGDSIVGDPALSRAAFDWSQGARWPQRFDVVIGNPPYVRHELFTHLKDHLAREYVTYHGMADLYVYFFERALSVLAPGGRLGLVVTNKWLRAGYAAPLRQLLAETTAVESLVDFGHAPLFEGADTFPCIVVLRKLAEGERVAPEHPISVSSFSRPEYEVPQGRLGREAWTLEPEAAFALYRKIRAGRETLAAFAGAKPYRGILTGYNDAFFVDDATRERLVADDPRSADVIRKCLRGQDVDRWGVRWRGTWLICARHGIDIGRYPAVARHLTKFRAGLEPRPRDHTGPRWAGRKPGSYAWYELQDAVDYWDLFAGPKIVYQVLQFHPCYALDDEGFVTNDKAFFIPTADPWVLAVLSSPLMWWHNWRYLTHMKDEALTPLGEKMEQLPIAPPDDEARRIAEDDVPALVALAKEDHRAQSTVLAALRTEMRVERAGQKLEAFEALSCDDFVAEVERRRPRAAGTLAPVDVARLCEIHGAHAGPIRERRRRARAMEERLAQQVERVYGLAPDEVDLLWATAPPRMPAGR